MDSIFHFGTAIIRITSANLMETIETLKNTDVELLNLHFCTEMSVEFEADYGKTRHIRAMCEKNGCKCEVIKRKGFFQIIQNIKKRPVLLIGLTLWLLLSLWVPGRIFFIEIEGNQRVPVKRIVEAAAECGITFGTKAVEVRSEKMKNAVLSSLPQLQWAGINTYGCVAVITVKERSPETQIGQGSGVSNIVAVCDGIVDEVTVIRGSAACVPGQAVAAGEILISGYTDCGIYIQACCAEGEVFAFTKHNIHVAAPLGYAMRVKCTETIRNYFLIIGKKRINFNNCSGILDTTCAKIYREHYLTLPGGFVLPIALCTETYTYHTYTDSPVEQSGTVHRQFAERYLHTQMQAGQILTSNMSLQRQQDVLHLYGDFNCREMIGISQFEETLNHGR